MFNTQRKRVLRESVWKPWRAGRSKEQEYHLPSLQSIQHERLSTKEDDIQYLEYWKYDDSDTAQPGTNCFGGIIHDEHVADWLDQRGPFAQRHPNSSQDGRALTGGIRLLVCEQRECDPLAFPLSRDSYLRLERHFHLSPITLPYFKNTGYSHTWRHNDGSASGGRNELIFVAKLPQKDPIANCGLSFSHDLDTGITTAFLYGRHILDGDWKTSARGAYGNAYVPQLPQIRELLESCGPALWAHPLLLPAVLLGNSVDRTQRFCAHELEERLRRIEDELGGVPHMAKGGAVVRERKVALDVMMVELNTVATEVVLAACVPAWQARFAAWLADIVERTGEVVPWEAGSWEVREMLEQLATAAANDGEVMTQLKARTELQMSALQNSLTQTSNLLVAQLAATASRDGASVKTIALLCTLFLPAIFVATLITTFTCSTHESMSTSSTSSTNKDTNPLLSKNLTTYCSTTIPLTILLLTLAPLWRSRAFTLFSRAYASILAGQDALAPAKASSSSSSPSAAANSTAAAIATSTLAGVPGVPGVGGAHEKEEREGGGQEAAAPRVPKSVRWSMWPAGPSGVSAPEAVGRRARKQRDRAEEDGERLV